MTRDDMRIVISKGDFGFNWIHEWEADNWYTDHHWKQVIATIIFPSYEALAVYFRDVLRQPRSYQGIMDWQKKKEIVQ